MEAATVVTRYIGRERRGIDRDCSTHPVKIYDERADKYFAGRTSNTSRTGALLILQRSMPIAAGDEFCVAIARTTDEVVVGHNEMIPAEVLRVTPIDAFTQAIAVRFLVEAGASESNDVFDRVPQAA